MIKEFSTYIKEGFDADGWHSFEIGDSVIVNGIVDDKSFVNTTGVVKAIEPAGNDQTNMGPDGEVESYRYKGTTYCVKYNNRDIGREDTWWCPKYNLKPEKDIEPERPVRLRWYRHGKLEENLIKEDNDADGYKFKPGDKVVHIRHNEFGKGIIKKISMDIDSEPRITVEFEEETGLDREPAKYGHGWVTDQFSLILLKERPVRLRWYRHGKLEETFSFDKIESEEVSVSIDDFVEEYDNIFKDRYRCIKAIDEDKLLPIKERDDLVGGLGLTILPCISTCIRPKVGDVLDLKEVLARQVGIWVTNKPRWVGEETEKFKIINGWDCDVEKLEFKKGDKIMLWPDKIERRERLERYTSKPRRPHSRDNWSKRLASRCEIDKKIFIPSGKIKLFNITEFLRYVQKNIVNDCNVIKATTDKTYTGKSEEIIIPGARYITSKSGALVFVCNRKKPGDHGGQWWMYRDDEHYVDITKPVSGKKIHWIDPEWDPYGEEDWQDENESFDTDFSDDFKSIILGRYYPFKDVLRFDLLHLKLLNYLREISYNKTMVIVKDEKKIKGRVYHIKAVKKEEGGRLYEFRLITKKGDKKVIVGPNDSFKIKIPKQSSNDPYNEEDWELYTDIPKAKKEKDEPKKEMEKELQDLKGKVIKAKYKPDDKKFNPNDLNY